MLEGFEQDAPAGNLGRSDREWYCQWLLYRSGFSFGYDKVPATIDDPSIKSSLPAIDSSGEVELRAEGVVNEAAAFSADSCRPAGLREVLAGEASRDDVDLWNRLERTDIEIDRYVGRPSAKHSNCARVDLAEQFGLDTWPHQSLLNSANSGKESDGVHVRAPWRPPCISKLQQCHLPAGTDMGMP